MEKLKKIIKEKNGNVIILILAVVMCVFMPILAVIYDVGQIRMYQADVKNAQEIAGLGCIGVAGGTVGAQYEASGGFDVSRCKQVATQTAFANLGISGGAGGVNTEYLRGVLNNKAKQTRLVQCPGEELYVYVESPDRGNHVKMQIRGLCYKPMFIKPSMVNFQILDKNPYRANFKFQDYYRIKVAPSTFSAVYHKS